MQNSLLYKFAEKQDGAMTALGLFLLMGSVVVGGLALDVASAYMARTQMQATADMVAHAALYSRDSNDEFTAITNALAVAENSMPAFYFGSMLTASNIQFGDWDAVTETFTASPGSDNAVFVDLTRATSNANPVGTYFLNFAGINSWNIRRGSVFETYRPTCFREGFVADDLVDMQSNNYFTNGFCIHSNDHVEMNIDNVFDSGTIVSMPDERDLVLPAAGFSSNPGVEDALRDGAYQIRILNELPNIIADFYAGGAQYAPSYISSSIVHPVGTRNVTMSDFIPNQINQVSCVGNQKLRFLANNSFDNIVVVTNCKVELGALVVLDNVMIATTHTGSESFKSAAELQIGRDDSCAPDGGSNLLSLGGMSFPALLNVYGSQLIAAGDIEFTANAYVIEGASFIAGGTISGTSNMVMGFCDYSGMENAFEADYFRMAS